MVLRLMNTDVILAVRLKSIMNSMTETIKSVGLESKVVRLKTGAFAFDTASVIFTYQLLADV